MKKEEICVIANYDKTKDNIAQILQKFCEENIRIEVDRYYETFEYT